MKTATVIFRGGLVEVEYHNFGWDPYANKGQGALDVQWWFVDESLEGQATDEEWEDVVNQIIVGLEAYGED